jgi:hypothetical protein
MSQRRETPLPRRPHASIVDVILLVALCVAAGAVGAMMLYP